MIKISTPISYELPDALEDYLCGLELSNWSIDKENNSNPPELVGYFEKKEDAEKSYAEICEVFEALPKNFKIEEILDSDWQNEYKKYLTSWSCKNLHWVPVWDKPNYKVPEGGKVFYFDAGLAFGTGDHPTTRLCAIRMLDYIESAGGVSNKRLIDAGCGSGILAISAKLLGFGDVYAFDRDEEAIRVSLENEAFNGLKSGAIEFKHAGISEGLAGRTCDIMLANIQADILEIYASELISAVSPKGVLVLSGILAIENAELKAHFLKVGGERIASCEAAFMGEWSDLLIKMA